jgi:hypothetical protein
MPIVLIFFFIFAWLYRSQINIFVQNNFFFSDSISSESGPPADTAVISEQPRYEDSTNIQDLTYSVDTVKGVQTNAVPESSQAKQTQQTPLPKAISRPSFNLNIVVFPESNSTLTIDGKYYSIAEEIPIDPGIHRIMVENPDYPIYMEEIEIRASKKLNLDLPEMYADCHRLNLIIGMNRRLQKGKLSLKLNGYSRPIKYTVDGLPYVNLCAGYWKIEFNVQDAAGENIKIDSIKTFPYSNKGPQQLFESNSFNIDFGGGKWRNISDVELTIY